MPLPVKSQRMTSPARARPRERSLGGDEKPRKVIARKHRLWSRPPHSSRIRARPVATTWPHAAPGGSRPFADRRRRHCRRRDTAGEKSRARASRATGPACPATGNHRAAAPSLISAARPARRRPGCRQRFIEQCRGNRRSPAWSSKSSRMGFDDPFKCRDDRRMIDNLAGLQRLLALLDSRQELLLIGDIGS